jgi:hypothetical protein
MVFACAVVALATPAVGSAGSLQPDAATAPISAGLQPDAFDQAAVPTTPPPSRAPAAAALPVRNSETLPPLRPPALAQPATRKTIITVTKPIVQVPRETEPVVAAPVTAETLALPRVVYGHAKVHSARVAVMHRAAARLQLPTTVRGSVTLPVPTVAARRDLLPAALALLALVATSGCLLTVAARSRQEELV